MPIPGTHSFFAMAYMAPSFNVSIRRSRAQRRLCSRTLLAPSSPRSATHFRIPMPMTISHHTSGVSRGSTLTSSTTSGRGTPPDRSRSDTTAARADQPGPHGTSGTESPPGKGEPADRSLTDERPGPGRGQIVVRRSGVVRSWCVEFFPHGGGEEIPGLPMRSLRASSTRSRIASPVRLRRNAARSSISSLLSPSGLMKGSRPSWGTPPRL